MPEAQSQSHSRESVSNRDGDSPPDHGGKRVVFLTAGAAGMFCGSCMHDNALAKALIVRGVDCLLQPVYTPIRTDEVSVASDQVFFGGIHIYATQRLPWLRKLPRPLLRMLDFPGLIRLATRRTHGTDPAILGELAVSMLRGEHGNQADEVERLVEWLRDEIQPDAIVLTNLLIGGSLPAIRQALPNTRIAVLLQGDDIFLDYLPEPFRSQATQLCQELVSSVHHFITNSKFYSAKMGQRFRITDDKLHQFPLSIDTTPFANHPVTSRPDDAGFRLGYFARIAPEKGLHHLVDAFVSIASEESHRDMTLHIAGWLGNQHENYLDEQIVKLEHAGLSDRFVHHGSPDLNQKVEFLRSLDVLCVPTEYEDPKGLFVLEALAAGVPVIQPDHGAFGELIRVTGGGVTFQPGQVDSLIEQLVLLKSDIEHCRSLADRGRANVLANHSIAGTAERLEKLILGN